MPRTSFINAKIFDGTGSDYLDESVVVVDNDCIVAVERKLDPAIAGDVIDVRGKTLMPGLIDAHCHVLGSSLRVTDTETQPLDLRGQLRLQDVGPRARLWLYDAARCGRRRDWNRPCGGRSSHQGATGVLCRTGAVDDGRTRRFPRPVQQHRRLCLLGGWPGRGDLRRSGCGACGRSGGTAPRRALHQDHALRRSFVAHRSALDGSIYRRGSSGRGGRGRPPPQIRRRSLPSAEFHRKSGKTGGQNHRARHSHR